MKKKQRFLIAKFVADPRRMEPVNIGVVLWAAGKTTCRFLSETEVPFIRDKALYRRWTSHWQDQCGKPVLRTRKGEPVPQKSPEFLEAMLEGQRGNYRLYEAGYVPEKIRAADRMDATQFLFSELVARDRATEEQIESSRDTWLNVFEDAGIQSRPEFRANRKVKFDVEGVSEEFRFDFAWEPSTISAVFQRVTFSGQQSAFSAAFMFEWTVKAKSEHRLSRDNSFALINSAETSASSETAANRISLLGRFSTVIDIADYERAVDTVARATVKSLAL